IFEVAKMNRLSKDTKPYFNYLPAELAHHVARFLDPKSAGNLAQTARAYFVLMNDCQHLPIRNRAFYQLCRGDYFSFSELRQGNFSLIYAEKEFDWTS